MLVRPHVARTIHHLLHVRPHPALTHKLLPIAQAARNMSKSPDPNKDTHDAASKMSAGTDTIDDELKQLDSELNVDDAFPTLKLRKPCVRGRP